MPWEIAMVIGAIGGIVVSQLLMKVDRGELDKILNKEDLNIELKNHKEK